MDRYSIGDLIKIGLRRLFWVFIPFCLLMIAGLLVLNEVPARYYSRSTLIVASQQVSPELVPSAVRAAAAERLEQIKAQMRARDNVVALAEEFGLFERGSDRPFSAQVEQVRNDIRITIDSGGNRRRQVAPTSVTFQIGFVHENPQVAFRVANKLTTDFLAQNVESRIQAAEGTATFFRNEEVKLRNDINAIKRQIMAVRAENMDVTPDQADFIRGQIARLTEEISRIENRILDTTQEIGLLRMQQPLIIDANERANLERITLNEKRRDLSALKARYTESYPGVVSLTNEVLDLEARLDPPAFNQRAEELLEVLNQRIADREGLSRREVDDLRQRRDDLLAQMKEVRANGGEMSLARLSFEAQVQQLNQRIENDQRRLEEARAELSDAEERLAAIPEVAAQLAALAAEENRLTAVLTETQARRAIAERSESLEEQQKAERVVVLESPVRPDVPTSPDKPSAALLITGAAGGVAAALGLLPVFLFPRIDTGRQLNHVFAGIPVVEVPEIVDSEERKFRRAVFAGLVVVSAILAAGVGLLAYKVLT